MAEPQPLGLKSLFAAGVEAHGALDELPQLFEAVGAPFLRLGKVVPRPPGCHERTPGARELGAPAKLLVPDEGVEEVELEGGPGQAPLFELAGHG